MLPRRRIEHKKAFRRPFGPATSDETAAEDGLWRQARHGLRRALRHGVDLGRGVGRVHTTDCRRRAGQKAGKRVRPKGGRADVPHQIDVLEDPRHRGWTHDAHGGQGGAEPRPLPHRVRRPDEAEAEEEPVRDVDGGKGRRWSTQGGPRADGEVLEEEEGGEEGDGMRGKGDRCRYSTRKDVWLTAQCYSGRTSQKISRYI